MTNWISKKLIGYLTGIIVILLVNLGLPEELAQQVADVVQVLTLAYLGSQGAIDLALVAKGKKDK